jgi:DHA1 family multidrug resistance protein-like MFS transporter
MEVWRKNLTILWGTQFLAMVGMNLVVPFLPFFIRQLGVEDPTDLARWSGLVFSGPFILSFFATPLWGSLGDRYGRKAMVVRAIFGLALSQVFIGFSQNVEQLFFFRMVQGAISGFIAAALALVSSSTPRQHMGYALGFLQTSSAGGMLLGPFFGGLLADLIGYREIFFITAALCALGGFVVLWQVRETRADGPAEKRYRVMDNIRLVLADRRLRLVSLLLVGGQISVLMVEPIFALFVESFRTETRFLSTLTGGIFSISGLFMIVSSPWWGRRNDRMGFRRNLAVALAAAGGLYLLHVVVADLFQLGFVRAALGFARGGVLPVLYALASLYAPAERRAGVMAIASSSTILGNMIGPVIGGYVAGWFGITTTFVANGLMLLAMSVAAWKLVAEPPRHQAAPAEPHHEHDLPAGE